MSDFYEQTSGDTYNSLYYDPAGSWRAAKFTFPLNGTSIVRFNGTIDSVIGTDTSDYFYIDLGAAGLPDNARFELTLHAFDGSAMTVEYRLMTYDFLTSFGPYSKDVLIFTDETKGTVSAAPGADLIAFQVYNYETLGGSYSIDIVYFGDMPGATLREKLLSRLDDKYWQPGNSEAVHVMGAEGDDLVYTGSGGDLHEGGLGRDILIGGEGNDSLYGYGKSDITGLGGGDGADQILGGVGNDVAYGGNGNDYLNGEAGRDVQYGENGNDVVYGGYGADRSYGGGGADILYGGSADEPDGAHFGPPIRVSYDENGQPIAPEYWTIAGAAQSGDASPDKLSGGGGADRIYGQGGNDIGSGGSGSDMLDGGAGDDRLDGGSGNDTIYTGSGRDVAEGSAGNDIIVAQQSSADEILDSYFSGGDGIDTVDYSKLLGLKPGFAGVEDITNMSFDEVMNWGSVENYEATQLNDTVKGNAEETSLAEMAETTRSTEATETTVFTAMKAATS